MDMLNRSIEHICLSPSATIHEVVQVLARHNPTETKLPAGVALIVESSGVLTGIVTDGDLRRAIASGIRLEQPVGDIMNRGMFCVEGPVTHSDMLHAAVERLREEGWHEHRLEKIVVVDRERRPIDVVSFFSLWQSSDIRFKRVGIMGLGFVGLTLGVTLADVGFNVFGMDRSASIADALTAKRAPFFEDGLPLLLDDHLGRRFQLVEDFTGGRSCDVYVIAVGTPLDQQHTPDTSQIRGAAEHIGGVLKRGDTVILRSTVPIGTTREVVIPILEQRSRLTAGEDFFVAFAPERTVEGRALAELRSLPQVIGGINRVSANAAASIFNLMTGTVLMTDTPEEAEMVKLVNNAYRDVSFAFANEVALICKRWGMDTTRVIGAANTGYPRSQIARPSPGVGGYCLEKDPFIYISSARARGYDPMLVRQARVVHAEMVTAVADEISTWVLHRQRGGEQSAEGSHHAKVYILGFAFKGDPSTSDMRGSTTVTLVELLQRMGITDVWGYDALVAHDALRALGIQVAERVEDGFPDADVVVVMNNYLAFRHLPMRTLMSFARRGAMLYDTWALYSREEIMKVDGIEYRRL